MKKPKDYDVRINALLPYKSYILQAPAGSGKTKILIDRYLTLLTQVEKPEEIIAITFTRKAAAEMRERILTALLSPNKFSGDTKNIIEKVLKRDSILEWNLTQNVHRFRILTIDALAYSFVERFPQLFDFGQSPTITQNPDYYYQMAIKQLWFDINDLPSKKRSAFETVLLQFNNRLEKFETLLIEVLKSREQWLYPIISHMHRAERLKAIVERSLKNVVFEMLQLADDAFPGHLKKALWSVITFVSQNLPQDHVLYQACINQQSFPTVDLKSFPLWRAISYFLLTKEGRIKKRLDKTMGFGTHKKSSDTDKHYKNLLKLILNELRSNTQLQLRLLAIMHAPHVQYEPIQWEMINALIEILPLLVAQLRLVFQQHHVLDFVEVNLAALRALGSLEAPSDLALFLDYQIKHMLVDEFQDTSIMHFHLIEKIIEGWQENDGRTLFLVGDPMQSIYRFRQAEVGLFLKVKKRGIASLILEPLMLNTNFRAQQSIIKWVNKNFSTIFPTQDDIAQGCVAYRPFTTIRSSENINDKGVHHHAFLAKDIIAEFNCIVALIERYQMESRNTSIAILVRSRRQVIQLLPYFQARQINYQATELQLFSKNMVIRDLTTLLQALLFPYDRLAWFALLRTPFCGLSIHDLLIIAKKIDIQQQSNIWQAIQKISLFNLSTDGEIRLEKLVSILSASFQQRTQYSLSNWVRIIWLSLRGPLTLKHDIDEENVQQWFDLLMQFEQVEENFSFEKFKSCIQGRYVDTGASRAIVQIMTIHKSKGLEFEHVILPELHLRLPAEKDRLLYLLTRPRQVQGEDFIIAPTMPYTQFKMPLNAYLRKIEVEKSHDEAKRLLYVAITRAKKNVHLMARLTVKNDQIVPPVAQSFLGMLWSNNQQQFIAALQKTTDHQQLSNTRPLLNYKRLPHIYFQNSDRSHPLNRFEKRLRQQNKIIGSVSWIMPDEFSRIVGIVAHEILHRIGEIGIEEWSLKKWHHFMPFYTRRLRQWQLNTSEIKNAINMLDVSMKNVLSDTRAHWLLSNKHQFIEQEYTLATQLNGKAINIIIDRTFVDNNIRWIIDYKTIASSDDIEKKLQTYKAQLEHYQVVMEKFDSTHLIKTGVYAPLISQFFILSTP
jgi:ATP-dependent exoDNAse (exonuclease V) beta subunit